MPTDPTPQPVLVTPGSAAEAARLLKEFLAPFPADTVKLKPQSVKGNRCLAIAYIDSRAVMDRLDAVAGSGAWQDAYTVLDGGSVECRLSVWVGDRWITKADVGSPSEQPDEGDRVKAAYSDAFKRAAVKWGIGRYLYRLPQQWMDYDPAKKCIVRPHAGPAPKAPPPPPAAAPATVTASAKEIATAFDTAKSREEGTAPWKRYEAALNAGIVSPADKAHIEAACKRFGQRFPAPSKAAK